ncbi:Calponin homology domain [Pseudocohnilembus persalinus]|uniref:Calponin homology domain n=1 Tax=Pseudocohnilembus persalinus TaxID=266149 RepID=A0A0V0QI06_PSEPJ|nr:Calponin homology domain [Pseudocohnilembus persalinus]|eukprot:KRX01887.1 Calponin homology domain [Pseudocohnilembus persalinus]
MADQSIGMMEGAFFVSKGEIFNWVNSLLKINVNKIEQLGTGAVYCQIIDSMYPGAVKMSRVNWKARNEWDFIINLKTLQQAFQKQNIKKYIEIERLAKAKYQDNLEFAQWIKRFFDLNGGAKEDYDPIKRRGGNSENGKDVEIDFSFVELRDNGKNRREGSQENRIVYNNKKLVSRSKSPILKNLERNPHALYNKSKEIQYNNKLKHQNSYNNELDTLTKKILEIEKVLQKDDEKENKKLQLISEIVQEAKKLPGFTHFPPINSNQSHHIQQNSLHQQKQGQVIYEENEKLDSPKFSQVQKKKRNTNSNYNNQNSQNNIKKLNKDGHIVHPGQNLSMVDNPTKRNSNTLQNQSSINPTIGSNKKK